MQTPPACAAASADAAEPIAGTATASTERWLIVENCDPWPRKGLPASMRADLRAAVDAAAAAVPGTRVVLARGASGIQETGIRIWIARANAHERAVRLGVWLGVPLGPTTLSERPRTNRRHPSPLAIGDRPRGAARGRARPTQRTPKRT